MEQIEEFERRLTLALDKIAAHLAAEKQDVIDTTQVHDDHVKQELQAENERMRTQITSLQSELAAVQAERDRETAQVQELYQKLADALNASETEEV